MQKKPGRKQIGSLIDEELYRMARAQAAIEGRTVGEVIDDAIRDYLKAKGTFRVGRGKTPAKNKP